MTTVQFFLNWAMLLVLVWGASMTARRVLRLKPCFGPIVALSAITVTVFYGGLLGYLKPVTIAVIVLCGLCCVAEIVHMVRTPFTWRLPLLEGMFLAGVLLFGVVLYRSYLVHYDNFTHWALVVKEMLITGGFPTPDNHLIEFYNYPTGTASFLYFICTVVGHRENTLILGQGLLIFSAFFAMFGVIEERRRFLLSVALGAGLSLLSLFNLSIRINTLLVDFVLPVLSLAAIALLYRHRKQPLTMVLGVAPILGLLMVVKSTGIIFAAIPLCYLLYLWVGCSFRVALQSKRRAVGLWVGGLAGIGLCFVPYLGWSHRMATVFAGVTNKFETDLTGVSLGKTQEQIAHICQLYWDTLTDLSQRATMGILLFQVLAILAIIVGCGILKKKWALPKVLIAMDVVLVGYLVGILAMYIYSMPMEEAIYLAAFERYASSIVILFGGVLTLCLTVDMEHSFYYKLGEVEDIRAFQNINTKTIYLRGCLVCVIAILITLTSEYNGMLYQEAVEQDSFARQVREIVGNNWGPEENEARYLVFAKDDDGKVSSYYLTYVARYYLRTTDVDAICMFYEDNFLNLLSQYDYLVIVESTPEERDLMERYFGLDGQPGIYDVTGVEPPEN